MEFVSMRALAIPVLAATLVLALAGSLAGAHETKVLADYRLSVGMRVEPPYTDERNGLDLIVKRTDDNSPVEGLEKSLQVTLTAPDGQERTYALRAKHGEPGRYTTDWVLTQPGVYRIRVFGYAGGQAIDEPFSSHEVRPLSELRFPAADRSRVSRPASPVEATEIWARPTTAMAANHGHDAHPAAETISALYMTLVNRGDTPQKLVAVRTPVARTAELHETRVENEIARMLPVKGIEIPAGGRIRLAPGGLHVMLLGLTQDLKPGDRFPVTLLFEDGSELQVEAVAQQG